MKLLIKKCSYCKRWDDSSIMKYNKRNGFYAHKECRVIQPFNSRIISKQKDPSLTSKEFRSKIVGKCLRCKSFDCKDNFIGNEKRQHRSCANLFSHNYRVMKPHKTDTCAFTGLPFGDTAETRPVGDHCHDTLLYRGHIWSAANRLEGALKSIMKEADCSLEDVFEMARVYLDKPGKDIGLKPYPKLGFDTAEEALEHYETTN